MKDVHHNFSEYTQIQRYSVSNDVKQWKTVNDCILESDASEFGQFLQDKAD